SAWGWTASGPALPAASFLAGSLALVAGLALCRLLLIYNSRDSSRPAKNLDVVDQRMPAQHLTMLELARARSTGASVGCGRQPALCAPRTRGGPAFRSLGGLGWSNATRRPGRSLATIAFFAAGAFLVLVVGANRRGAPADPTARAAGTGGFTWIGRTSLAVVPDPRINPDPRRFRLTADQPEAVEVVPLRVRDGDDASCLNLNRPQEPRLLGVVPGTLAERGAFTFAAAPDGAREPWLALEDGDDPGVIPAIGDASSVTWSLHRGLGDTIEVAGENGRPFRVRIVATLADSILQGDLLVDEARLRERFPSLTGYRMFLIDAPAASAPAIAAGLTRDLAGVGLELESTADRLAALHAVQNTYLAVFEMLGGLGLLLGGAGLGIVVARNVAERRGELAVLRAVGFSARRVRRLLLAEHGLLLLAGAGAGAVAAAIAILPLAAHPGGDASYVPLLVLLVGLGGAGAIGVELAARLALRGPLLEALARGR
ncbi:MAG: FtsX-like permease family protein, partial [Planctomycetota bacterium]